MTIPRMPVSQLDEYLRMIIYLRDCIYLAKQKIDNFMTHENQQFVVLHHDRGT